MSIGIDRATRGWLPEREQSPSGLPQRPEAQSTEVQRRLLWEARHHDPEAHEVADVTRVTPVPVGAAHALRSVPEAAAAAQDAVNLIGCVEVFSTVVCIIRIPESTSLPFSP
jgi:hypothetical protein